MPNHEVLRPIMTTQYNKAYLYWIENRAICQASKRGILKV
ncbi:hypothetical protein OUO_1374 [Helicobacter pylori R046Wa]|nr:hypothetical protein OUO_1374 [Helicobacter pylori R046Wa]